MTPRLIKKDNMIQTAKLQNPGDLNNPTLRIAHKLEKTEFQKFYQGFHSFYKMDVDDDGITFSLPSCNLVAGAILDASKRIDELELPLAVVSTGERSTTFIIRRK